MPVTGLSSAITGIFRSASMRALQERHLMAGPYLERRPYKLVSRFELRSKTTTSSTPVSTSKLRASQICLHSSSQSIRGKLPAQPEPDLLLAPELHALQLTRDSIRTHSVPGVSIPRTLPTVKCFAQTTREELCSAPSVTRRERSAAVRASSRPT